MLFQDKMAQRWKNNQKLHPGHTKNGLETLPKRSQTNHRNRPCSTLGAKRPAKPPQDLPRRSQEAPMSPQDVPQEAPRRPKKLRDVPQEAARRPPRGPKTAEAPPRRPSRGSKTFPRRLKTAQDGPDVPRPPQVGADAPRHLQDVPETACDGTSKVKQNQI